VGFGRNEAALASSDTAEFQSNEAACGAAELLCDNVPDWGYASEDGVLCFFVLVVDDRFFSG
jgi:hypothetical protein